MSDRVGFSLGTPDGLLAHFLRQPLDDFQRLYEEELSEFPDEYDVGRLFLLKEVVQRGRAALETAPPSQANRLVLEYYAIYANIHYHLLPTLHDYWDKLIYHETLQTRLKRQQHTGIATLHAYILTGRAPFDDPETQLFHWVDYPLGYWTAAEAEYLHEAFNRMLDDDIRALTPEEGEQHALQTLREALGIAVIRSTGLIFVMG